MSEECRRLWTVVEDPAIPEDARAAAAVLLERDDAARARLRVAATDATSPRLRVALDHLARGAPETDDPIDDVVTCLAGKPPRHARSIST